MFGALNTGAPNSGALIPSKPQVRTVFTCTDLLHGNNILISHT